jgi:hypothetical protein
VKQCSWPPAKDSFNIFFFGGSTTFGYQMPTEHTIPSHFQNIIRNASLGKSLCVYNFGRGSYFSTQEHILFEKLIYEGHVPDMAIFIDGVNEVLDVPWFTERFIALSNEMGVHRLWSIDFPLLKYLKLKVTEKKRMAGKPLEGEKRKTTKSFKQRDKSVVRRYLKNKQMTEAVAASFDVQPIFVWQPKPSYKYDYVKYHPFPSFFEKSASDYYEQMANYAENNQDDVNFIWCADIQEGYKENFYVDKYHYNSKLSRMIAEKIFAEIMEKDLFPVKGNIHFLPSLGVDRWMGKHARIMVDNKVDVKWPITLKVTCDSPESLLPVTITITNYGKIIDHKVFNADQRVGMLTIKEPDSDQNRGKVFFDIDVDKTFYSEDEKRTNSLFVRELGVRLEIM